METKKMLSFDAVYDRVLEMYDSAKNQSEDNNLPWSVRQTCSHLCTAYKHVLSFLQSELSKSNK